MDHSCKPKPSADQSLATCEQRRAQFIRLLALGEQTTQLALKQLPHKGELYARLRLCNRFIERQRRANNPDTFLTRRLLGVHRQLIQQFESCPQDLAALQLLHRGKGRIPKALSRHDPESLYRLSVTYQIIQRLRYALSIGSVIGILHNQFTDGLKLYLAEIELAVMLQPGDSLTLFEQHLQRGIEGEARRDGEEVLMYRQARGYVPLPRVRHSDPLALAHPAGAVTFSSVYGPGYDIDVSLLTDDPLAFPDPERSARKVPYSSSINGCTYTDLKRRAREVRYDREIDGLILSA